MTHRADQFGGDLLQVNDDFVSLALHIGADLILVKLAGVHAPTDLPALTSARAE